MRLTLTARCLGTTAHDDDCDWTVTGPDADKQAEKHIRTTGHVGTLTSGRPESEGER